MSDSVRPHRRQPTTLCRPWDSPGKNTGVGFLFLLHRLLQGELITPAEFWKYFSSSIPNGEIWGWWFQNSRDSKSFPWCIHTCFTILLLNPILQKHLHYFYIFSCLPLPYFLSLLLWWWIIVFSFTLTHFILYLTILELAISLDWYFCHPAKEEFELAQDHTDRAQHFFDVWGLVLLCSILVWVTLLWACTVPTHQSM